MKKSMSFGKTVLFSLATLLFLGGSVQLNAQNKVIEGAVRLPNQKAAKVSTVKFGENQDPFETMMTNTHKVYRQGVDPMKDELKRAKEEANRKAALARDMRAPQGDNSSRKTNVVEPTLGTESFFGNFFDGIPNDNSIAAGRNGTIVSATNSRVFTYNTSGAQQKVATLASFFASSNLVYDPKVVFDQNWNRYILTYLNGDAPSTSRLVVCFSETDDPTGNWHIYTFPGSPDNGTFGSTWVDFPQVGLTANELIVTGNLFNGQGTNSQYSGGYVYQIDKDQGFNGVANIDWEGWGGLGTNYFAMHPANPAGMQEGPDVWMINSRNSAFGATSQFWLHHISDTAGSPFAAYKTYQINGNAPFSVSPDAPQQGTNNTLDTRDMRVRGSYYMDGRMYVGMNVSVNNKCGIYFGVVEGLDNPAFASVSGTYIGHDTLEFGFPGMTAGGCVGDDGKDKSTLLFANFSSPFHFPGTAVMMVDSAGNVSEPVICKEGATYVTMFGSSNSRWGDYAQLAPNPENPGEAWGAGYYGYNSSGHYHGTWISQVYGACTFPVATDPGANIKEPVQMFPNPTSDRINFVFDVKSDDLYTAELYTIDGKLVQLLMHDGLGTGQARLTFNTGHLDAGVYLVKISNSEGPVFTDKLVLTK